ncbi:MAG: HD-GYP domain-containing protein [Candidatus Brocadiia bacterium]
MLRKYIAFSKSGLLALFVCGAAIFFIVERAGGELSLSYTGRAILYVLLCMLLASAYAFHVIAILARENEVRQEAEKKRRQVLYQMVENLAFVIAARDPYTAGHQRRVARLSSAIAENMGLPEERIELIFLAASIHDIGKIRIPVEILTSPAGLSEEQFALVRRHPSTGAEVMGEMDLPWPLGEIIHQHHERLDGSGYPRGLSGEKVLLEARILAVADTVEAIVSNRPYRAGLGREKALNVLKKNKGTLYDAKVVDVCIELFRKGEFHFEETAKRSEENKKEGADGSEQDEGTTVQAAQQES